MYKAIRGEGGNVIITSDTASRETLLRQGKAWAKIPLT